MFLRLHLLPQHAWGRLMIDKCPGSRNQPEAVCLDNTWYPNPRGICPDCRRDIAILGDGTLRNHKFFPEIAALGAVPRKV